MEEQTSFIPGGKEVGAFSKASAFHSPAARETGEVDRRIERIWRGGEGLHPHQRPHARALGAATVPTTRGRGLQRSWRAGGRARGVNAQCGRAKKTPRTVGATVLPPPCTYDRAEKCAASAVTRATRWYRWCGRA